MLANVQQGLEPWTGFTKEELILGLESLKGGRARMAEAATKGRKKAAKASAGPAPEMGDLLKALNLDKLQ
jgi:hypothetical protein